MVLMASWVSRIRGTSTASGFSFGEGVGGIFHPYRQLYSVKRAHNLKELRYGG